MQIRLSIWIESITQQTNLHFRRRQNDPLWTLLLIFPIVHMCLTCLQEVWLNIYTRNWPIQCLSISTSTTPTAFVQILSRWSLLFLFVLIGIGMQQVRHLCGQFGNDAKLNMGGHKARTNNYWHFGCHWCRISFALSPFPGISHAFPC